MQANTKGQLRGLGLCLEILGDVEKGKRALEDALSAILDIACRTIGQQETFGTLAFSSSSGYVVGFTWSSRAGVQREPLADALERGLIRLVGQTHSTYLAADLRRGSPASYVSYSPVVRSELALPIFQGSAYVGAISVASSRANAFGEEDSLWLQQAIGMLQFLQAAPRRQVSIDANHIDDVLDNILKTIIETTALPEAYAAIVIADNDRVVPLRAVMAKGGRLIPTDPVALPAGTREWSQVSGLTGRALRTGQVIVVPDVNLDPDYVIHIPEVRSEVVIPIRRDPQTEVIGALDVQAFIPDAFPNAVVTQLTSFAEQLNTALTLAQSLAMLEREQKALERLAKVAPAFVRKFSLERVYDLILEAAFSLLPTAQVAQILTIKRHLRTSEQSLVMVHRLLAPEDLSGNRPPRDGRCEPPLLEYHIDQGVTGRAARTQQTQYVPDIRNTPEYVQISATTRSELAIPISLGRSVVAILNIESETLDGFSERDRVVAELLASEAALAISNAQDYTRKIELLNIVVKATREVLSSVDDSDRLIHAILAGAMHVCNAEDGYCALILRDGDRLWVRQEAGEGAAKLPNRILEWTIEDGLTGQAIREKRPIYVPDTSRDPTYIATTGTMRTDLVVPLFDNEGEAVGAISLESPALDAFDEHAVEALLQFGPPVVAALIKSQLVDSLRQQQQNTIDLIRQLSHLLSPPISAIREVLQEVQPYPNLPPSIAEAGEALDFIDLTLEWLAAQADVLGHTQEEQLHELIDVHDLVGHALGVYRYYAKRKHVTLIDTSPTAAVIVSVNRAELLGAFVELLVNAVKYSPIGGNVSVRVDRVIDVVQITVEDEGRGVPLEEREHIFERGVRGTNRGNIQSSGLGLYFVYNAMRRISGDAFVESRIGPDQTDIPGSRFVLRFPVSESARGPVNAVTQR